jgi:hypothetical protein
MHLSVNKDAPSPRTIHAVGRIAPTPFLGDFITNMSEFDFRQAQDSFRQGHRLA